jgi:hypothetical protein
VVKFFSARGWRSATRDTHSTRGVVRDAPQPSPQAVKKTPAVKSRIKGGFRRLSWFVGGLSSVIWLIWGVIIANKSVNSQAEVLILPAIMGAMGFFAGFIIIRGIGWVGEGFCQKPDHTE